VGLEHFLAGHSRGERRAGEGRHRRPLRRCQGVGRPQSHPKRLAEGRRRRKGLRGRNSLEQGRRLPLLLLLPPAPVHYRSRHLAAAAAQDERMQGSVIKGQSPKCFFLLTHFCMPVIRIALY
jgi:hypothetical protein